MAHHKRKRKRPSDQTARTVNEPKNNAAQDDDPDVEVIYRDMEVEHCFAVEWGERLESSKAIARGGKSNGYVPGATGNFP